MSFLLFNCLETRGAAIAERVIFICMGTARSRRVGRIDTARTPHAQSRGSKSDQPGNGQLNLLLHVYTWLPELFWKMGVDGINSGYFRPCLRQKQRENSGTTGIFITSTVVSTNASNE